MARSPQRGTPAACGRACLFAVRLLIDYRALRVGDRLTVRRRRTIKQSRCIDGRRRHHLKGPTMKLFTGICLVIILASCAGPGPFGPRTLGPETYGPETYGPETYGPGPYGPETYGPETYGPETYGPGPYGPGPYASAVQPAMSGPQLPVSYLRKCYDCLTRRQDANPN
jgi:hypothetical protein